MNKNSANKILTAAVILLIALLLRETSGIINARKKTSGTQIKYGSIILNTGNGGISAINANVKSARKNLDMLTSMKNFSPQAKKLNELYYLASAETLLKDTQKIADASLLNTQMASEVQSRASFYLARQIFALCDNLGSKQAKLTEEMELKLRNGSELDAEDITYLDNLREELAKICKTLDGADFGKSADEQRKKADEIKKLTEELTNIALPYPKKGS